MKYKELVEIYETVNSHSGRLKKVEILAEFFKKIGKEKKFEYIYLLKGRVVPGYDTREFGISGQIGAKAVAKSLGVKAEDIIKEYKKIGDLGDIAQKFISKKKQNVLFSKELEVEKVFDNLKKLLDIQGKGTIEKKLNLISEILGQADGTQAKYIIRTLLGDLRIGVADGTIRDAIALAYFGEDKKEVVDKIGEAYDLSSDLALVLKKASKGISELEKINVIPGRAMKVMLPVKVTSIDEAFSVVGKPAAIEHKYDGFRVVINKSENGIKLFTRNLEEVTKQFPDVVSAVEKYVDAESFIIDSEIVGYDFKTGKYKPFEAISQRIKRKYDIDKLIKELPVEVNVFDIIYLNSESLMDLPFKDRRKRLEKIIKMKDKVIRPAKQIITDDLKKANEFYQEALKLGEEGIMVKNLEASYRQGRRVGYMVKMKPQVNDLDLVIVGAEYGSGKRAGWLTSYFVACRDENGNYLEVGKVSSGLKELEQDSGTTYEEMTKILKPLIIDEDGKIVRVRPEIIVAVTYQNIQESPSYNSGYALRFPRITTYRPDKDVSEINTLSDIKKEIERFERKRR